MCVPLRVCLSVSILVSVLFVFYNPSKVRTALLTLGAHAQEGYGTCLVCVGGCRCVSYSSSAHSTRLDTQNEVRRGLS